MYLARRTHPAPDRNNEALQEVEVIRRTLADVHRDEAILAERKRTLLELLRLRSKELLAEMERVIEATQDADQLAEWLRRFATAKDLGSIGILPPR
jgi:hypothetical protein